MTIFIALTSIIVLTALVAVMRASTPIRICPICSGVSGTWLWMLVARGTGWAIEPGTLALLMGGSVVGIAYQLDRRLPASRGPWFKACFVPAGFLAMYGLVYESWGWASAGIAIAVGIGLAFFWSDTSPRPDIVAEAEQKLEDCCD
jgi:hypothetical protein